MGGRTSGAVEVAACLVAKGQKCDFEVETFCVHGTQDPCVGDKAFALGRNSGQENAVLSFVQNSRDEVRLMGGDGQIAGALAAEAGMKQQCYIATCITGEVTHTLKAEGFDGSEDGTGRGQPIVNWANEVCPTLRAGGNSTGGDRPPGTDVDTADSNVVQSSAVRRLTPVECERLQGFPDDYTQVPYRNKPAADGPRYKAIGNSWAVPCARWVGMRAQQHLEAIQ